MKIWDKPSLEPQQTKYTTDTYVILKKQNITFGSCQKAVGWSVGVIKGGISFVKVSNCIEHWQRELLIAVLPKPLFSTQGRY